MWRWRQSHDTKLGIEKAVGVAVEEIRKIAKPIESKEAIAQVASNSCR